MVTLSSISPCFQYMTYSSSKIMLNSVILYHANSEPIVCIVWLLILRNTPVCLELPLNDKSAA